MKKVLLVAGVVLVCAAAAGLRTQQPVARVHSVIDESITRGKRAYAMTKMARYRNRAAEAARRVGRQAQEMWNGGRKNDGS